MARNLRIRILVSQVLVHPLPVVSAGSLPAEPHRPWVIQVWRRVRRRFDDLVRRAGTRDILWRGRPMLWKRRTVFGRSVAAISNIYFRLSGLPSTFCCDQRTWQRWEVSCFRMLNDGFDAFELGNQAVCAAKLPGESLWAHLRRGSLTTQMIQAAAHELRRIHGLWSNELGGPWSHGDACVENFIYDTLANRARLIDFEFMPDRSLPSAARHAEDLLDFLLGLMPIRSSRRWFIFALRFLKSYDNRPVIVELCHRLDALNGAKPIWWVVRTHFTRQRVVDERLKQLRRAIDHGAEATAGTASAR